MVLQAVKKSQVMIFSGVDQALDSVTLIGGNHRSDSPIRLRYFATAEVCCIVPAVPTLCFAGPHNAATKSCKHLWEETI